MNMKSKEKEMLRSFFEKAARIAGNEEFEDLRRKDRQAIFDAFIETGIDYEMDGDKDGCVLYCEEPVLVAFFSHSDYIGVDEIRECVDNIRIAIGDKDVENLQEALLVFDKIVPENEHALALLNTSILTTAGEYVLHDISLTEARELVDEFSGNLDSAIGHASTAEIMSTLLGANIVQNRQMFEQKVGQKALVFKLNGRPEEGKILSSKEIEEIGYKFQLLERKN